LVEGIQNYIGSLNWGYRVSLKEANVTYLNALAEFQDEHTLKVRTYVPAAWTGEKGTSGFFPSFFLLRAKQYFGGSTRFSQF
jgi:hypothetical protein